jgi:cell division protein FtsZ
MTAKSPLEQGIKKTKIRIVGVGGAGGNAVSHMSKWNVRGVELIAVNCDIVDLKKINADKKIQIGKNLTQGLGAGMKPEVGRKAAEEGREEITEALKDSDIVFVVSGMGGGTGTLSAGVVADISKTIGALTIGIVILPFAFEGQYRMRLAKQGLADLKQKVDAIIVIPNDKIINKNYREQTVQEAFSLSDDILRQAVQGISDLIVVPGLINLDFADIKAIMQNSGPVLFGVGQGRGEKRVEEAVDMALNSPFLNANIKGATGLLFNISGGDDLSIEDVKETARLVTQSISPQAKIVFGAIQDSKGHKDGTIKLTVIATGVEQND